ncbi:MAG: glycosyltransferase family 4 protein [Candidatus Polarisedimenticolaceae bacterium]|nr:glycosyltransferase family 4 protein [Candidatus Polarisedimenticolaceae bacterium]
MKCLFITSIFPPIHGGSAVVYENICRYAPANSMCVLAPWRNYQTGEELNGWRELDADAPYAIHRIELVRPQETVISSRWHSLWISLTVDIPLRYRVWREASRIIRSENIDVVCIGELVSGSWLGLLAKRWLGCKMVNYIHGEEITTVSNYRFFGRKRRKALHNNDAIVAVSNFTRQALIDLMDVPPEKIELITNGVDLNKFQPGPVNSTLMERYGLEGKRILLTVGRLIPRKGFDTTIQALPAILKQCPNVHYLIIGNGPYEEKLRSLTTSLGLTDHVTFAGRVPDDELADHYRSCDLFIMPNRELSDHDTEGFGLVFLEANACGRAVIGGRAGGVVEAVRDKQNGLLVDGTKTDEVAASVIQLLTDDALRNQIEKQGLQIARDSSMSIGAQRFYCLCQRLVGENATE